MIWMIVFGPQNKNPTRKSADFLDDNFLKYFCLANKRKRQSVHLDEKTLHQTPGPIEGSRCSPTPMLMRFLQDQAGQIL